jgi:hypothetical protein
VSTKLSVVLTTYQELRDRIYAMARQHGYRPDWVESTRSVRLLLLYDSNHVVVARTTVPVRDITVAKLDRLREDLAPVFGTEWME